MSGANTGGGVHVNGARDRSWNFTLDGIDINETSAGGSNFAPLRTNPDSLAEFKVLTGNTTAEFGRNSGGQVAMISRSGTNRFHGTGFYFGRRPEFNANEWEFNIDDLPKREFVQDIYGFSVGGPIKRNKAFFFSNVQILQRRADADAHANGLHPERPRRPVALRRSAAATAPPGTANASVDASGNVLPGLNVGTYNIPGNDPQRLGIHPDISRVVGLTPLPNNFTVGDGLNTAGYTFAPLETEEQYDLSFKVDYVFNPQHYTFVRYSKGEQNTICDEVNGGSPPYPGHAVPRGHVPRSVERRGQLALEPVAEPGERVRRRRQPFHVRLRHPDRRPEPSDLRRHADHDARDASTSGNLRTLNTLQFVNNTSYNRGAHAFKLGTEHPAAAARRHPRIGERRQHHALDQLQHRDQHRRSDGLRAAGATFSRPTIGRRSSRASTSSWAGSGRSRRVSSRPADEYAPGGTPFVFATNYPEIDIFFQDTWKPASNLTVDLGLRWEAKLSPRNDAGPHPAVRTSAWPWARRRPPRSPGSTPRSTMTM